jgi:hypothetical protein
MEPDRRTNSSQLPSLCRLTVSPNKHMQRAGTHKVLGRGRSRSLLSQVLRARVLTGQRAGADVNRSATFIIACVLGVAYTFGVNAEALGNITLREVPILLSADDLSSLKGVACASTSIKDVRAWTYEDQPRKIVLADVVCAPHRDDDGHPAARYMSCKRLERPWICDKGIERSAFVLSDGRSVNIQIIDASVREVDQALTELGRHKLSNGSSALSRVAGSWTAWADRGDAGVVEFSFAPEHGTRVFLLYRTCSNTTACSYRFVQKR